MYKDHSKNKEKAEKLHQQYYTQKIIKKRDPLVKFEEVKARFGDAKVNQTKATALFAKKPDNGAINAADKSNNKENVKHSNEPRDDIKKRKTLKPNES